MRTVFETQFPHFRLDSNAPLLVVVPRDRIITEGLDINERVAGIYLHGWERQYALVRLDALNTDVYHPDVYAPVYHEYIHSLLHVSFDRIPRWLDEGLAEFFAYTRFEGDRMYIGAPPKDTHYTEILDRRVNMPLAEFVMKRSAFARDEDDTHLFYAQSWALTHFLTFGPGMEGGARLNAFMTQLQTGVDQKKAFETVFGPFEQVQKDYEMYLRKFTFTSGILPAPAGLKERDFVARQLSIGEADAILAGVAIRFYRWPVVKALSERAQAADPNLALAHEDLGFWYFNEGRDEEALKEFSLAVDQDSTDYLARYAKTMISVSHQKLDSDAEEKALLNVLDEHPTFAAAFVELAKIYAARGELLHALGVARRAEQLEPSRSGYRLLTGEILLRMGRAADAAAVAVYVATRWHGPDHEEAFDLFSRVPASERKNMTFPPGDDVNNLPTKASTKTHGVVKSVTCRDKSMTLTLDRDGELLTFRGEHFPIGFSDTLWMGADHFTPCFHTIGLRAVVQYKPTSDKSLTGTLVYAGLRDTLPDPPKPITAQEAK